MAKNGYGYAKTLHTWLKKIKKCGDNHPESVIVPDYVVYLPMDCYKYLLT